MKRARAFKRQRLQEVRHYCASRTRPRVDLAAESIRHPRRAGPARNSDASLFRHFNVPKYFPLDRHATILTVQCSENETHWSEGPLVRLFKKEAP